MQQQNVNTPVTGQYQDSAFSRGEQEAWERSQVKLGEAAKVGQTANLKFGQANQHLNKAEEASRAADDAARRQAEADRELQRHHQGLEGLKAKLPGLHEAHDTTGRAAEEKLAAHQHAQRHLSEAEQAAAERENALRDAKNGLEGHHAHHRSLEEKLAHHRGLTKEREEAHRARQAEHANLRRTHDANLAEVDRLVKEHSPLGRELQELEARYNTLRKKHDDGQRLIYSAKDKANHSHQRLHSYDPQLHNHALEALESHKQRERELAEELAAAKHRAHEHQHHHDQALAAHKKALDHFNTLQGRAPSDKEVVEAQRAHEEAAARLAEHEKQAKHYHGLYTRHRQGVDEHGGRAAELQALAERHAQSYHNMRREGDDMSAKKEALWHEAKHEGDTGVGHFKEEVTKLDSRLDHLGDKIKQTLTGNKGEHTTTHTHGHAGGVGHPQGATTTHSSSAATREGPLVGNNGQEVTSGTTTQGVNQGTGITQGHHTGSGITQGHHTSSGTGITQQGTGNVGGVTHPQGASQVSTHDTTTGGLGHTAGRGTSGATPLGTSGHNVDQGSAYGRESTVTGGNVGTGHSHPVGTSSTSDTTTTADEGGIKSKIKGLFSSKH